MKWALVALVAVALSCSTRCTAALSTPPTHQQQQQYHSHAAAMTLATRAGRTDPLCIAFHCWQPMALCLLSDGCRRSIWCMLQCAESDAACRTTCFFRHADDTFGGVAKCGMEHACLPPMVAASKCPVQARTDYTASLPSSLAAFDAVELARASPMVVALGSDPVYDCFDCQKLDFVASAHNESTVSVHWSAAVDDANSNAPPLWRAVDYALHSLNRPEAPSTRMWTKYLLFGTDLEEHYFVLDGTDDFMLYFYCGYGVGGEYQGAQVFGRPGRLLDAATHQRFQQALDRLDSVNVTLPALTDFCMPDTVSAKCNTAARLAVQL